MSSTMAFTPLVSASCSMRRAPLLRAALPKFARLRGHDRSRGWKPSRPSHSALTCSRPFSRRSLAERAIAGPHDEKHGGQKRQQVENDPARDQATLDAARARGVRLRGPGGGSGLCGIESIVSSLIRPAQGVAVDDSVAALRLGLVHRRVGPGDHLFGRRRVAREMRDPDRHRHPDRLKPTGNTSASIAAPDRLGLAQRASTSARGAGRSRTPRRRSAPRSRSRRPSELSTSPSRFKDLVPEGMAVTVIQALEMVDVKEHHRESGFKSLRADASFG